MRAELTEIRRQLFGAGRTAVYAEPSVAAKDYVRVNGMVVPMAEYRREMDRLDEQMSSRSPAVEDNLASKLEL